LVRIASKLATPPAARRTAADQLRTLGRDLWWHQVGVSLAARRAGATLMHLPAALGPVRPLLPTVVTIHDTIVLRFPHLFRTWQRSYARIVLPRVARSAAAVITGSEATRADIIEQLGVAADRIAVVAYGVDTRFTPVAVGSDEARAVIARYELPRDFVLTVGAIEPRKNLPRIIEAVEKLGIPLVHAGPDGWLAADVPRNAARFLGYVPTADLRVLYGLARALVYPSLWEGFGLPVVEAMACGCPVITSTVSSLPEVAGGAALLVDPTVTDALAAAIEQVWTDDGLRQQLAERGLERARLFTWERTARETVAVYERVAG
jgi:glycosyltransferase involved in cell wall biosynthesis